MQDKVYTLYMKTHIFPVGNIEIAEVTAGNIILATEQDALDLMGNIETSYIVVHEGNITPAFFDLSTKVAGNILQKFSNYRVKLAIIGDFTKYPSKVLKDFIYETNRVCNHLFVDSLDEVKQKWGNFR